ncbi:serine threonine- kinase Nek3 [Babesia ovata]|uniref:non-specific serine/threonine protein kinase n=1 Tax=Babesia ovata TaxID=189622 RepID=A0A2H6KAW0_9APIC|nr:serine threonine- kinase Nek3 [Babesia ovata]GBE60099.1 serine threonine- kinase Nek3 [Babesia ovata]
MHGEDALMNEEVAPFPCTTPLMRLTACCDMPLTAAALVHTQGAMDVCDGNAVVRRAGKDVDTALEHMTTRSTIGSIDDMGGACRDGSALRDDEGAILLPFDCIENHGITQLVAEFGRRDYGYCGEAMPKFSNPTHCTFHHVRSAMGHLCFAKVVDLRTCREWQSNSHAIERAEIAQYLSYYSVHNEQSAEAYKESFGTGPRASCNTLRPLSNDGAESDSPPEVMAGCATSLMSNLDSAQTVNGQKTQLGTFSDRTLGKAHIVCQYDWFLTGDQKLITVYENCDGGDLHTLIARARSNGPVHFDEQFITDVFTQICMGVEYFHARNIVHGDIKASNIFFKDGGRPFVKVGDYDTCHVDGVHMPYPGTFMYTAPELIANPRAATSFESDVWALGCLFYELLTLSHPFASPCTVQSMKETFRNFQVHIEKLMASVPGSYSLIMRNMLVAMLNVNPMKRPTVGQLLSILCSMEPQPVIKCQPRIPRSTFNCH